MRSRILSLGRAHARKDSGILTNPDVFTRSGLKTASDLSLVKAAGISHLINLSRAAANCAEDVADPSNKHDFKEAKETGLWSLRCTVFGLKGEPYRDIFRRLGVPPLHVQ